MVNQSKSSRIIHITLWIAQALLGVSLIWASVMKLMQPIDSLSAMWPWAGQVPTALVRFTGVVDLLGGLGLILPSLLRIKPKLTPIAALSVLVLMLCAGGFHVLRGEASMIGPNIVFAVLAAFIAWGRLRKAPIQSR